MNTSLIGLDIGSRWIKAAQWRRAGGRWGVRAAAWPRRTPGHDLPPAEAARLAAVLARRGFTGDLAVLVAPGDRARVAEIDLPAAAAGPGRRAAARMELARVCRLDPAGFEFELWDLPRSARSGEAPVAAAVLPHADADAFVEPLQDAGLAVASIAAQSEAFRALLGAPDKDAIDAIIDLGASALALTVLVGGVCVYERRLPELGLDEFAKSAAEACRFNPELAERVIQAAAQGSRTASDALAGPLRAFGARVGEEVAVSLEYASHRYPHASEGRMTAVGGGAQLSHLLAAAGQTLGLDVLAAPAGVPLPDDGPVPPWGAVATAAMAVAPPHRAGAAA